MANEKVLVADDEVQYVDVVAYKLENAGIQVIRARDGQAALELALSEKPHLLILDYQMPALTGLEVCQQLRDHPDTAQIPVILLTARGLDIDQEELQRCGVDLLMPKPFSPRELLAKVQEIISASARSAPA